MRKFSISNSQFSNNFSIFNESNGKILKIAVFALFVFLCANTADAARIGISKPGNNLGLIGWWTMDGADLIPNVRDKSGNSNHGNLAGQTSTTTVSGKIGQALLFDGVNDYVDLGDFAGKDSVSQLSISYWFKRRVMNAGGQFVGSRTSGTVGVGPNPFSDGNIYCNARNGGTAYGSFASNDTDWHYLTYVFDGTQPDNPGRLKCYLDGVNMTLSFSGTVPATTADTSNFMIGRDEAGGAFADGSIDEVRVYNRALSVSEVLARYNSGSAKNSTPNSNKSGLENDLISHWTFDGTDVITNVRDTTGQGRNGNLFGQTSTTTTLGKIGQALIFDGVNDYVDTSNFADNLSNFSVSTWIKAQSSSVQPSCGGQIVSKMNVNWSGGGGTGWTIAMGGGGCTIPSNRIYGMIMSGGNWYTPYTNATYNDNNWHHVVMVVTGGTVATLYVDGSPSGMSLSNSGVIGSKSNSSNVRIGRDYDSGYFAGSVDDSRIYNRALSVAEVSQLYNSGSSKISSTPNAGKPALNSGLVGHWTFDGKNIIQNVVDSSGQGNRGTLSGFTSTTTAQGKIGQGLDFDGVNDQVSITDSNNSLDAASVVTTSAWVYPRDLKSGAGWSAIVGKDSNYYLGYLDNSFSMTFSDGSWHNHFTGTYPPNQWYHVVGVIDNINDRIKIYINGTLITDEAETANMVVNNNATTIGQDTNQFVEGIIDDVRVYTKVLSANEVKQLYNLGR